MADQKIDARIAIAVVSLTKYLMEYYSIDQEEAYKKLMHTKFFKLLNNSETGLYHEPDWYLQKACITELEKGRDEMVKYITDVIEE